jgi:hypothetical protein
LTNNKAAIQNIKAYTKIALDFENPCKMLSFNNLFDFKSSINFIFLLKYSVNWPYFPKDLTVLILPIVSIINELSSTSSWSDLFDILFNTEAAMAPFAAIRGENTNRIKVSFQEYQNANNNDVIIIDKFRKNTDIIPVKKLCS